MGGVQLGGGRLARALDPWVLHALGGGGSFGGVDYKRLGNVILAPVRDTVPEGGGVREAALLDVCEHDGVLGVVEGVEAANHEVENDSQRPDVHLRPVGGMVLLKDLGRDEVGRAAHRLQVAVAALQLGQPEVDQLDQVVLRALRVRRHVQEILWLQVPVRDADVVQVVQRVEHVGDHRRRLVFGERLQLEDTVQHRTSGEKVEDQAESVPILKNVPQLDAI
mmetsp:Transcript_52404/g.126917  ORF Transcript_52404/g.126917 Transcript_52404/m.126917 type:complete len:222 (+) Transcript_52404:470-1135(+)